MIIPFRTVICAGGFAEPFNRVPAYTRPWVQTLASWKPAQTDLSTQRVEAGKFC